MKRTLPIFALLLIGVLAVGALAMPFGRGGFFGEKEAQGGSKEMEAVNKALDNGDLSAWKTAMVDAAKARADAVTDEQFQKMIDGHQKMAEKRAEMEAKRAEMEAKMAPVNAALDAGDYSAWKAATASLDKPCPMSDKITEENFPTFVELHKAMQNKDFETVKTLKEKLGFGFGKEGFDKKGFGKEGFGRHGGHFKGPMPIEPATE